MTPMVHAIDRFIRELDERLETGLELLVLRDCHAPDIPEPPYPPHCIAGTAEAQARPGPGLAGAAATDPAPGQGLHQRPDRGMQRQEQPSRREAFGSGATRSRTGWWTTRSRPSC